MNNFHGQDADMIPQQGGFGGNRGGRRGGHFQSFDSPFSDPSQYQERSFQSNQQQSYYNRGNRGNSSNWQRGRGFRGGRGRGRANHRGRGVTDGFYQQQQPYQKESAKSCVIPAMTQNPWKELEKQYEAEQAARKA